MIFIKASMDFDAVMDEVILASKTDGKMVLRLFFFE
jgi:hypothetical protein